jgi:FtsP/CotA-like multicopper oxidase with cupredoxin domain
MSEKTETAEQTASQEGMTRRDLLKVTAATGAAAAITAVSSAPSTARAQTATCTGLNANEAYPVSPLVMNPFTDPLPIPSALRPVSAATLGTWASQPGPGIGQQDCDGGTHQLYPGQAGTVAANMPAPSIYWMKMQVNAHSYTNSAVRTMVDYRTAAGQLVKAGTVVAALPKTTIYGFNGTFYSTLINAEYGKPNLLRFQNFLDQNPQNLVRGDYGSPEFGFLTHLHNGHTAAESDGNPHHRPHGYLPGEWFDAMYLNYAAGGDEAEKMSSLWFHDHFEGHTGANVYKGMAGLYPVYDPGVDDGREATSQFRLPGVRTDNADGTFDVAYDHYLALHDVAIDDGAVGHQDFHGGCGESRPDLFGRGYFKHFPNHGFVGDIFCVNGKAFPVVTVKRRKYRFRFLGASISRIWEMQFMTSAKGPKSATSLGYKSGELQGQYRLTDAKLAMDFAWIGSGGGLFPSARQASRVEVWPAGRPQVVIDFTKYRDGRPTKKGDVIYLVNSCKMLDGRKQTASQRTGDDDPAYRVPVLKIIIGDDAPDNSLMPTANTVLRPKPRLPGAAELAALPRRTFELQRGGFAGEIQWLINGHPFDPAVPLATVTQGQAEVWTIRNGGAGWAHPMHMHQEEHQVLTRNGVAVGNGSREDDCGKDDVIDLDGGEEVEVYRNFRTYTGKYVAHCHNLAHEDHAMMFGWILAK